MLSYEVSVSNLISLPTLHFNNMAHALRLLSTHNKGPIDFYGETCPLREYLFNRKEYPPGTVFTLKKIVEEIQEDINDKAMYMPANPEYIFCTPELAAALQHPFFRADMLERILLPLVYFQEPDPALASEPPDEVIAQWNTCGGYIPKMVAHGLKTLKLGKSEIRCPPIEDKRVLNTYFRWLMNSIAPDDYHKVVREVPVSFQHVLISATIHLSQVPKVGVLTKKPSTNDLIYDISGSHLCSYFGTSLLSSLQLKGLLLYEWANLSASDAILEVPRLLPFTEEQVNTFLTALHPL